MTYSSICQCVQYAAHEQPGTTFGVVSGLGNWAGYASLHQHSAGMYVSSLEACVQEYAAHAPSTAVSSVHDTYQSSDTAFDALVPDYSTGMIIARQDHFDPGMLLRPDRPAAPFVGAASAVQTYVQELFFHVTGQKMGSDVTIEIVSKEELQRVHEELNGTWSDGILGFCINKKGRGQSVIMVREGALDSVLLTIGHEIGHSRSTPLQSKLDEEAKAFAFQMAWACAIVEHDVAGLAQSIELDPRPAKNGLHDVACLFVERERRKGLKEIDIFNHIIRGELRVAA